MKASDHRKCKRAPACKYFRDAGTRSDERLEFAASPSDLLAPELNGVCGIRSLNWKRASLVRIDQGCKSVQLSFVTRAGLGGPKGFNSTQSLLVRRFVHDRFDHWLHLVRIDTVVVGMGSDEANECEKKRAVLELNDQAVRVSFDIEHDTIPCEKIGGAEHSADVSWSGPRRALNNGKPESQRLLGIGMLGPEINEGAPVENAQC